MVLDHSESKNQIARNLVSYSASWYSSGKKVLPTFATGYVSRVETIVADAVSARVDAGALLDQVDTQLDQVVAISQEKIVKPIRTNTEEVYNQLESVRGDVYSRIETTRDHMTTRLEEARDTATDQAVAGIQRLLEASEAGVDRLLPEQEEEEEEAKTTPASEKLVAPRMLKLTQTVSKRVQKRVASQLATLRLRENVGELVHVNLIDYASQVLDVAQARVLLPVGEACATGTAAVTNAVTPVVQASIQAVPESVTGSVTDTWALVRKELLNLQAAAAAAEQALGEDEKDAATTTEQEDGEEELTEEELSLVRLIVAVKLVLLPAAMTYAVDQVASQVGAARARLGYTSPAAAVAEEQEEVKTEEATEPAQ